MIKAVIFDCFNVLYIDPIETYERDYELDGFVSAKLDDLDDRASHGLVKKAEFISDASRILGKTPIEVDNYFFQGKKFNQSLMDYAQSIRQSVQIGMLSNIGSDMMSGFFSDNDLLRLFDAVVLSGKVGMVKPDPGIYKLICDKIGVLPEEAIMVDDIVEYCDGARSIGMQAVHYRNNSQAIKDIDNILR